MTYTQLLGQEDILQIYLKAAWKFNVNYCSLPQRKKLTNYVRYLINDKYSYH